MWVQGPASLRLDIQLPLSNVFEEARPQYEELFMSSQLNTTA